MTAGSDAYDAFAPLKLVASNPSHAWDSVLTLDRDQFFASADAGEAVDQIAEALRRLPHQVLRDGNWLLTIPPVGPDGFTIDLSKSGRPVRAFFGTFEQEFETLETALLWVERGLSRSYQLRIVSVGARPREFRLEPTGAESSNAPPMLGVDVLAGGFVMFTASLFRRATTVIKRNAFAPRGA